MLFLPLTLVLMAVPNPALLYEQKCLYCHSDELPEHPDFTAEQWAKTVQRMRAKAQVLITRDDSRVLTRFILGSLRLHLPAPKSTPRGSTPDRPAPAPVVEIAPAPPRAELAPPPETLVSDEAHEALDAQGAQLIAERCSKCHTLNRVFGKLDSLERSLSTVARMRAKTGSGITHQDAQRIEQFLRAQFATDESRSNQ